MNTNRFCVLVVMVGMIFGGQFFSVSAEEAKPLTAEQENLIASLISEISETPEQFVLRAFLRAPNTNYSLEIKPGESQRLETEHSSLYRTGLVVGADFETPTIEWRSDISCGIFRDSDQPNRYTRVWHHPEGPKPLCFHENTTSHVGTVSVTGTYSINIFPAGATDGTPVYFHASWRVYCMHSGSESGTEECTETLISMRGVDGQERVVTEAPKESILDDIDEPNNINTTYVLLLAFVAGIGGLIWYRLTR